MLFLEDDDVAAVKDGILTIHRRKNEDTSADEPTKREIHTLKMELQQIMKGAVHAHTAHSCFRLVSMKFYSFFVECGLDKILCANRLTYKCIILPIQVYRTDRTDTLRSNGNLYRNSPMHSFVFQKIRQGINFE